MSKPTNQPTKLAYPEFDQTAQEGFAVKALINAVHDKDTVYQSTNMRDHHTSANSWWK